MKDLLGQTHLPLERFNVKVLRTSRRTSRTWWIIAGSSATQGVAQTLLANLIEEGYTGHVHDATTGRTWTPTTGWLEQRSTNP